MPKFLKSLSLITASLFTASPALALPGTDFEFNRGDSNPTIFHTTTYNNGLSGQDAEAFKQFVNVEASALDLEEMQARELNISDLVIQEDQEVKVYFIGEITNSRNNVRVSSSGSTVITDASLFDDAYCVVRNCEKGYEPLMTFPENSELYPGDYVSLGNILGGTTLDISLRSRAGVTHLDPVGRETFNFYTDSDLNQGEDTHILGYEYQGYLIVVFEDWFEGDFDFNDVVIALDISQENLACIPSVGEVADPNCVVTESDPLDPIDPLDPLESVLFPD